LPGAARDETVERVGHAGNDEHRERPPQMAVHDQDHEERNQEHPQQRELVGRRQRRHLRPASASRRDTASIASGPLTVREGWNALSAALSTPDATASDAAG